MSTTDPAPAQDLGENQCLERCGLHKRRHRPTPRPRPLPRSGWGAPRIHGELLMLGFDVSERTISRWMRRAPRDPEPAKRWVAFLRNHREAIAAMDFFTVPSITFGVLYCFFVISHDRRKILHFNVTNHPTSTWIVQQRERPCRIRSNGTLRCEHARAPKLVKWLLDHGAK